MKVQLLKISACVLMSAFLLASCQSGEKSSSSSSQNDSTGADTTKRSKKSGLDQAPLEGNHDGAN